MSIQGLRPGGNKANSLRGDYGEWLLQLMSWDVLKNQYRISALYTEREAGLLQAHAESFRLFLLILGSFKCSVVTSVTLSSRGDSELTDLLVCVTIKKKLLKLKWTFVRVKKIYESVNSESPLTLVTLKVITKIPHTGDKGSLDRCG